jgi:predicted porin
MKKSLLAVAAIGAFASAAQAQSSVTVYGILDVGFVGSAYSGTAVAASANNMGTVGTGGPAQKANSAGFGQSAESTSRLGFKGSEDLGGGLAAIFTVETAINPDGAASAFVFNRQTFVGVKKNGTGTAAIGTQYTPIFDVMATTDAAGMNNLVGNAVYSGSLQSTTGTFNQGQAPYTSVNATQVSLNQVSSAYVTRASNAIKFQSDRIGGLAGQVFYAASSSNQTVSGTQATTSQGPNVNNMFGANLDYVWNKLNVVAAYQTSKSQTAATSPASLNFTLANGTAGSLGVNNNDSQTYAAATYDFGILKAYGQYITRKAFETTDSNTGTSRTGYQLGAKSFITPTISVYATYGLGKSSYLQAGSAYANFRSTQLGTDYFLSKRTNLYAAYGSFNQSSPASSASALSSVSGVSGMNYAVGVRHTF